MKRGPRWGRKLLVMPGTPVQHPHQGTNTRMTSRIGQRADCRMQMKKSAFLLFLISYDYERNIEISSKWLFASGVVNFPRNSVNTSKGK